MTAYHLHRVDIHTPTTNNCFTCQANLGELTTMPSTRLPALFLALLLLLAACAQDRPTATFAPTPTTTSTPPPTATAAPMPTPTASPTEAPPTTATPAPTLAPSRIPTEAQQSGVVYNRILERVENIRGVSHSEAIAPQSMSREELADSLNEELEEAREDLLKSQELYRLLGLIPRDADLSQLLLELYGEQIAGFYDTETQELYIIGASEHDLSLREEITIAHEFVHALQQQSFNIYALTKATEDDSEAASALSALIEGDATTVETLYVLAHFTREQLTGLFSSQSDYSVFDAAPYFLQQSLLFPYVQGQTLLEALLSSPGRWDAVNDAYSDPPVSTEQVLHPEKYLEGEEPIDVSLPDVAAALGKGWEEVYGDVMGEFFIRTYLETRASSRTAADAAAGWGGDRFTLLKGPKGERLLAALLAWDTPEDARQFFDALESSGSVPTEGFLGIEDDKVLWVLSPSQQLTDSIRALWTGF